MTTKSLATALVGHGADLRVKNIVLEILFSIVPILWSSSYKIFDSSDDLLVDLLFRYVKRTLVERGYYKDTIQGILEEQFQDLSMSSGGEYGEGLEELSSAALSILGDIALKRLVYEAMVEVTNSLYPPNLPKHLKKQKIFTDEVLKRKFILKPLDALNLMDDGYYGGRVRSFKNGPLYKEYELDPQTAQPIHDYTQKTTYKVFATYMWDPDHHYNTKTVQLPGDSGAVGVKHSDTNGFLDQTCDPKSFPVIRVKSKTGKVVAKLTCKIFSVETDDKGFKEVVPKGGRLVVEPYMSIVIKDADEIISCVDGLFAPGAYGGYGKPTQAAMKAGFSVPMSNKEINQYLQAFTRLIANLTVGTSFSYDHVPYPLGAWNKNGGLKLSKKVHKDLMWLSGRTINCSPDDFKQAYDDAGDNEWGSPDIGMSEFTNFIAAITEKMTLSIRLNLEQGPFGSNPFKVGSAEYKKLDSDTGLLDALMWDRKTLSYRSSGNSKFNWQYWLTLQLASADKDYDALDWEKLIEDAKEGEADWTLDSLFEKAEKKAMAEDVDLVPLEKLFIQLLQTPEFDAITQSILLPATIFNTIQTIPNAEIGFVLIKMMRQRGAFKGMDEALDAWLSLVKNYLFGDFPWMTDCSLKGII